MLTRCIACTQEHAAAVQQLLQLSHASAATLTSCMGWLLLLQRASAAATAISDPCLPVKDKYRDASMHRVALLAPLPAVPSWMLSL